MTRTLTFLHTSPVHIATFDRLLAEADTSVQVRHIVEESLLAEARETGITPRLDARIHSVVKQVCGSGDALLVCTCSTIGGAVEQAALDAELPVVRVDRAMAEQAVALGRRILVVAALASTLEPTRQLILQTARRLDTPIEYFEVLCADAWSLFEANDLAGYHRTVAACIERSAQQVDVVVLAQASMAGTAELCRDLGVPVLSSPRPGLEAALRAYRALRSNI